ncbi:MAG TPA: DUF2336 domain-containing protein [Xanthobacteraceae bacterium]|nr:DUF2336 domain-containing protein [Xanthobacteraceae bacterium]
MSIAALAADIEAAVASHSSERRNETLRKVTDLFVGNAPQYKEEQVALFDSVLGGLAKETDVSTRAELSQRLAAIDNAPINIVASLAADDAIEVAKPILTGSRRLNDAQLAALAAAKSQDHMQAIAARRSLSEQVTDVLLSRGDARVARTVAGNESARVSEKGFETLVGLAAEDPRVAECVVVRPDIPQRHLRTLAAIVPEPVRLRLAANNPRLAARIREAMAQASQDSAQAKPRDYSRAKETVAAMVKAAALGDEAVLEFAKAEKFEEAVVALAALNRLSIDAASRLLVDEPTDTLLIAAKAGGLSWPTAKSLLLMRTAGHSSPQDLEDARLSFVRLKAETAVQGIKLYKLRANQR